MILPATAALLSRPTPDADARGLLRAVLAAALELVSIEGNDFAWSSWENAAAAIAELQSLRAAIDAGAEPDLATLGVIFAATGPMQELSLSSGWSKTYLAVAERYDEAERALLAARGSRG